MRCVGGDGHVMRFPHLRGVSMAPEPIDRLTATATAVSRTHPPPPTQTRSHHITQIVPRAVLSTAQSKEPYSERQARTGACLCLRLCFGGGCPGGGCPGDDGRGKGGA